MSNARYPAHLKFGEREKLDTEIVIPLFGEHTLACPKCAGTFLHQENVTIFERAEDGPEQRTFVHRDGTSCGPHAGSYRQNPSPRRQGLIITFSCESCGPGGRDLAIYQHQGQTVLDWTIYDPS